MTASYACAISKKTTIVTPLLLIVFWIIFSRYTILSVALRPCLKPEMKGGRIRCFSVNHCSLSLIIFSTIFIKHGSKAIGLYDFAQCGSLLGLKIGMRIACLQAVGTWVVFQLVLIKLNKSCIVFSSKLL